jgi:hypothetical protein
MFRAESSRFAGRLIQTGADCPAKDSTSGKVGRQGSISFWKLQFGANPLKYAVGYLQAPVLKAKIVSTSGNRSDYRMKVVWVVRARIPIFDHATDVDEGVRATGLLV